MRLSARVLWVFAVAANVASAAGIRERIRQAPRSTSVTQTQASDLTLTVTEIQVRPIQNWVRAAGTLDRSGRILSADLDGAAAAAVRVGQRARVFSTDSKSSMLQAKITRVTLQADGRALVAATLANAVPDLDTHYLIEVVVDYGEFLSVPNEAIIEEGDKQVVYVQERDGGYQPREISTDLQGERYTQVLKGVAAGEQVVTTGSFFIDAEYKMKGGN